MGIELRLGGSVFWEIRLQTNTELSRVCVQGCPLVVTLITVL